MRLLRVLLILLLSPGMALRVRIPSIYGFLAGILTMARVPTGKWISIVWRP